MSNGNALSPFPALPATHGETKIVDCARAVPLANPSQATQKRRSHSEYLITRRRTEDSPTEACYLKRAGQAKGITEGVILLQISLACVHLIAYPASMETFGKILRAAVDAHASDIHLKVAHPVTFRINQQLITVDAPHPTDEWIENVISHIVPKHLQAGLERERETDFSYYIQNVGRFRTNVFQHGGK